VIAHKGTETEHKTGYPRNRLIMFAPGHPGHIWVISVCPLAPI
jgi:hypothetical protein